MKEVEVWGLGALKQTYRREFDHESGEYKRVPNPLRVQATIEFGDVPISDVGHFNNQKAYLLTDQDIREFNAYTSGTTLPRTELLKSVLAYLEGCTDDIREKLKNDKEPAT